MREVNSLSGGSAATKGFLLQALVCILEALENENWKSVIVEPKLDTEKVDIIWNFENRIKVVQVKSSINQIGIANIKMGKRIGPKYYSRRISTHIIGSKFSVHCKHSNNWESFNSNA